MRQHRIGDFLLGFQLAGVIMIIISQCALWFVPNMSSYLNEVISEISDLSVELLACIGIVFGIIVWIGRAKGWRDE